MELNDTTVAQNLSGSDEGVGLPLFRPPFRYTVGVIFILIAVVGTIGNIMVIFVILANKSLRVNPTNLFLLSLAISDLITVTLAMPFHIEFVFVQGIWKHGVFLCYAHLTAWLITVPTSILTLLAISIDRFMSLKDPLRRYRGSEFMNQKMTLIIIGVIWFYCILWALLPFMGWREKDSRPLDGGVCFVPYTIPYLMISSFLNFLGPLLFSCVFFILAFVIACKHQRNAQILGETGSRKHHSKEEKKFFARNITATKTTLMFMAAFFLCWQPYRYFSIASNLYGGKNWRPYPFKAFILLMMLGYLNTALNPFLFAFRNKRFGSTYKKLFLSLKRAVHPMQSSTSRRPSSLNSRRESSTSEIPDNDTKDVRLQSIRKKMATPNTTRKDVVDSQPSQ